MSVIKLLQAIDVDDLGDHQNEIVFKRKWVCF